MVKFDVKKVKRFIIWDELSTSEGYFIYIGLKDQKVWSLLDVSFLHTSGLVSFDWAFFNLLTTQGSPP